VAAQVKSAAGCSVNDRESPCVTLRTGTWRARRQLLAASPVQLTRSHGRVVQSCCRLEAVTSVPVLWPSLNVGSRPSGWQQAIGQLRSFCQLSAVGGLGSKVARPGVA
jgi:hypothetical protein